jgi:hypothetical protein
MGRHNQQCIVRKASSRVQLKPEAQEGFARAPGPQALGATRESCTERYAVGTRAQYIRTYYQPLSMTDTVFSRHSARISHLETDQPYSVHQVL